MSNYQIRIDEILSMIHKLEMYLLLENLSDDEQEMTIIIMCDMHVELKQLGFEVTKH